MQDKKQTSAKIHLIFSTLLLALAIVAEFYTMVNYPAQYLPIALFAVLMLIFLNIAVNSVFTIKLAGEKRRDEQYESILKSEKASYLLLKKYFEEIDDKIDILQASAKVPTEEIVTAQKGVAKAVISKNRENAEAIIASNDQVMDKITEFEDRLSNNNGELISEQKDISSDAVTQLIMKQQELVEDIKDMEIRLNQAIMQTQQIISSQPVQLTADVNVPTQPVTVQMTGMPVMTAPAPAPMQEPAVQTAVQTPVQMESAEVSDDDLIIDSFAEEELVDPVVEEIEEQEIIEESVIDSEPEVVAEERVIDSEPEVVAEELVIDSEPEVVVDEPVMDNEPKVVVDEPVMDSEPEVVVDEPMVDSEPESAVEEVSPMPDLSDPNKKLSPEEIAAMFANADSVSAPEEVEEPVVDSEPEIVAEPAVEEVSPMPDLSDPNKKLSPEEIAAMFANADSVSAPEEVEEPVVDSEPEIVAEPAVEEVSPMPDLPDPNKKLSQEEIAAIFANADDSMSEPADEPVAASEPEIPPMPDLSDPNKKLSDDEIAALIANL